MGKIKTLYADAVDALTAALPLATTTTTTPIYVMTRNGTPCGAYTNKMEADLDAWVCNASAHLEPEDGTAAPTYTVVETELYVS